MRVFFPPRAESSSLWSHLSSEVDSVNGKQVTLLWFSLFPVTTLHYGQLKIHDSVFSSIIYIKNFFSYNRAVGQPG